MTRIPVPQPPPPFGWASRLRTFAAAHIASLAATAMVAISTFYGLMPPQG